MTKKMDDKKRIILNRVISGALLCVALFFAVMLLGNIKIEGSDVGTIGNAMGAATLFLAVFEFAAFISKKKTEGKFKIFRIVYVLLYLSSSVASFCVKISSVALSIGATLALLVSVLKRVSAILRHRRQKRDVIVNSLIIVLEGLMIIAILSLMTDAELAVILPAAIMGFVILAGALISIFALAISQFNANLLKKIVRKTYAGEILFGLLLLIVSFSMAMITVEDNITSFGDALWYCFAIVTTIGFGDFAAASLLGRLLSVILGLYGIVVVSIVTSIIVNFYNEVKTIDDNKEDGNNDEKAGEVLGAAETAKSATDNSEPTNAENDAAKENDATQEETSGNSDATQEETSGNNE